MASYAAGRIPGKASSGKKQTGEKDKRRDSCRFRRRHRPTGRKDTDPIGNHGWLHRSYCLLGNKNASVCE